MEQQCSTTCNPLVTSPSASAKVLPCSMVISPAMSFRCFLINSWYLNMIPCLWRGDVLLQDRYALVAAATAAVISSWVEQGTLVTTSLVAGL